MQSPGIVKWFISPNYTIFLKVLTLQAVRIAVDLMLLVDDDMFHILFNSLLGQASVNHLHLHAMYWPYDSDLINRVGDSN